MDIVSRLEQLMKDGEELASKGGNMIEGYNGDLQPDYTSWRIQVIYTIREIGAETQYLLKEIEDDKQITYFYSSSAKRVLGVLKGAIEVAKRAAQLSQPATPLAPNSNLTLFPIEIVQDSRDYIERIATQANSCYSSGWYDASAVMVRRLVETLIIECFESHNIAHKIKDSQGNYLYLSDLITIFLNETTWNIGRNTKTSLPKLKNVGDLSAHSRRFIAKKQDLEKLVDDLRVTIQELIYIAGFDKAKTPMP